ncbi:hypothetical protein OOU_Y34scaffold00207g45 [Pyricularia oryzae Y34]|uniref:Uncharacterized protein n=2 Tax=Pyricularia oryzae TaxID=318829 RepID=A0AA97P5Q3_PYRO3|nr:hypothetical protein OOU_Y34scaffold00207g45 [Pyricularia oryzae Y34]
MDFRPLFVTVVSSSTQPFAHNPNSSNDDSRAGN